jgi:hypothetical protein
MNAQYQFKQEPFTPEGPQPLVRETAPGAAYPVASLGPLRAAVEAVQGTTQAPMAIPAQSALAVASLAVQGFADVETLGGPRPLSLYALTIARSGERKSACDAPLMAPLREHEKQEARAHRDALESWLNAHALWRARPHPCRSPQGQGRKADGGAGRSGRARTGTGRAPIGRPNRDRTDLRRTDAAFRNRATVARHIRGRRWAIPGRARHEYRQPAKDAGRIE